MVVKREYEYLDMKRARGKKSLGKQGVNARKNNYNYTQSGKHYGNPANSNHIVVKVTGGAKSTTSMIKNLDYDTRENTLPLYDKDGLKVPLDEAKQLALEDYEFTTVKKNKTEEPRRTYRLMFSMKGKTDPDILKKSVHDALSTHFKNHNFYYSLPLILILIITMFMLP